MNGADHSKTRQRFIAITLIRVMAAVMIALGFIIAYGANDWLADGTRQIVGLALVAVGFIDLLLVVPLLAQRWRSPRD